MSEPADDVFAPGALDRFMAERETEDTAPETLPPRVRQLVDRFIDNVPANPSKPLTDIYQAFYLQAQTAITSGSARAQQSTRLSGQQMLTAQEVKDRRHEARLRDRQAAALEELVEQHVCQRTYTSLLSPDDLAQDSTLHARIDRLIADGLSWQDLGIDLGADPDVAKQGLIAARDALLCMNQAKSPRGKLHYLNQAHKVIVELLTRLHDGSSSADEILPMLIYSLISAHPETVDITSTLNFVRRYRARDKIDGEAAYCLTNLEAAAAFLSTVGSAPSVDLTPRHQRRISDLFQPPATALGAAGDAVRSTADLGIRNITSALDQSLKLVFGGRNAKTLDEVRRLVEPEPEGILQVIAGRRAAPEAKVNTNPAFRGIVEANGSATMSLGSGVESMRSLGNSLMRGLGRTTSYERKSEHIDVKTLPPIARFLNMSDAANLTMADVPLLLADYKRLAQALRVLEAFP